MQMISAINAELAKIGYKAVKLPKPKRLTVLTVSAYRLTDKSLTVSERLKQWKPVTEGGRCCKSWMRYWASLPKPSLSLLPDLLALFGYRLKDVQPWPHCHKGNYGPALANACRNGPLLLPAPRADSPIYRGFPDGWREVQADAAAPRTIIVCE